MIACPSCVESAATAFCRECGKGVCDNCMERRDGVPYCPECAAIIEIALEPVSRREQAAVPPPALPPSAAPDVGAEAPHPFLAGLLGFVPGLGAVYNGQYVKGVVHAVIFGMLLAVSTSSSVTAVQALLVPIIIFFVLYMPVEAVRTAQAIRRGEQVEEMSGIVGALMDARSESPVPGILFIAIGVFFLLFTLEILQIEMVLRAWPLLFVGLGAWRLYASVQVKDAPPPRRALDADPLDLPE